MLIFYKSVFQNRRIYYFFLFFYLIICSDYLFCVENVIKKQNQPEISELPLKKRKVDMSTLREQLAYELIKLLQIIEVSLKKVLKEEKKENIVTKSNEIMTIFEWTNRCINDFHEDPSAFGRNDIELYLNQAQKYELFLKNI